MISYDSDPRYTKRVSVRGLNTGFQEKLRLSCRRLVMECMRQRALLVDVAASELDGVDDDDDMAERRRDWRTPKVTRGWETRFSFLLRPQVVAGVLL